MNNELCIECMTDDDASQDDFFRVFGKKNDQVLIYLLEKIGNSVPVRVRQDIVSAFANMIEEMKIESPVETLQVGNMLMADYTINEELREARYAKSFKERKEHLAIATNMMRLYNQQMETLRKFRNGGKQTITVNHNHINAMNAIVGNVQK